MNFQKILVPIAGVAVVLLAYRSYGWAGVAAAVGGLLMWVLLHFTRMMQVLRRAADQPIGYVASAVMLNAKLKPRADAAACGGHDAFSRRLALAQG
jgi:hypothetical protein